ncbi:Beta-alanine-activating enzyme [Frankliniella fusca]|uniref:Beta-alanine-activating enzyme n=1 Tax=Frankliniella fusca TaxID=407009 RepID=A0AAE1GUI5_9NEOP|nr:Beta-alanine-activating enzyme [Frankliniella fusca]
MADCRTGRKVGIHKQSHGPGMSVAQWLRGLLYTEAQCLEVSPPFPPRRSRGLADKGCRQCPGGSLGLG